ncbi:MAG: glycosyltransferase, partial [Gemmatimonadota bacterium]|nr:glycosyltransferase [Gemmatimonadota bacterium]
MDEIRVHRVIARMNVGGPAFHVTHLSRLLSDRCRTTLITGATGRGERDMTSFARGQGVQIEVLPSLGPEVHPGRDIRALGALIRLFRRERPHIVHSHTAKAGALARIAAVIARVPIRIHTFHGHVLGGHYFSPARTRFFIHIERQLARITHRIVAISPSQRDELADVFGVAPRRAICVIPLGLELGRFRTIGPGGKAKAKEALGLPPSCALVSAIGRMVPIKRHDLLIRAFAELTRSGGGDWRLAFTGGGPEEAGLKVLAAQLAVADRITWLGWEEDIAPVLEASDALVQTSDDEGTPVSVIEAVVAGIPIVATRVGGLEDM